jgi:hypothetical protein
MASEPINIFSHSIDPAGVTRLLRRLDEDVRVDGPDDDWSRIEIRLTKQGWFRKSPRLVLGHDSEYYDGENWPMQVFGMQNYFSEFEDGPTKQDVLRLIGTFRFALSVPVDDLDIDSEDERLSVLHEVCQHLDGAFFTPTSLRDASGRVLINAAGEADPEAVFPQMPPTEDHPDAAIDEDYDEDEEPEPPAVDRVVRRMLALTAVAGRATLELDAMQQEIDNAYQHRERMVEWVNELGVGDELEAEEWKVLQRPVGALEQQDFIDAMWRVEGLAVLAWALHIHPLPAYDELVVPMELYDAIGLFDIETAKQHLNRPDLRSREELEQMAEHILAFHWRVRDFSIRPERMDFEAFSRNCWFGTFDISKFQTVNGDLAIAGQEISQADPDEISKASSTAMERHQAINWLHGYSTVYSETDTST